MDYEKLLDNAYANIKESPASKNNNGERFEIPKLVVQVVGNKTAVSNFSQCCSYVRRSKEELCKFLSKELAAMCKPEGDRLIINRKIMEKQIQDKFKMYVDKYVICKQCKKPDTEIVRRDGMAFMHCLACGANTSLGKA